MTLSSFTSLCFSISVLFFVVNSFEIFFKKEINQFIYWGTIIAGWIFCIIGWIMLYKQIC